MTISFKQLLNSKISGYIVGVFTAVFMGVSHIETEEEALEFTK